MMEINFDITPTEIDMDIEGSPNVGMSADTPIDSSMSVSSTNDINMALDTPNEISMGLSDVPKELFPVIVTITSQTTGTSNKSDQEIWQAVADGKLPVAIINMSGVGYVIGHLAIARNEVGDPSPYGAFFVFEEQTHSSMAYITIEIDGTTVRLHSKGAYLTSGDFVAITTAEIDALFV